MLLIAASILIILGVLHSVLGEKFILIRLFRRDNLPKIYGSDAFTKGTIRFAWHITSIAWFGFASLLFMHSEGSSENILYVVSLVFLLSAALSAYFTKGKHFSWWLFLAVAILSYLSI